ncbi:hypothetical protein BKA70DRAFT_371649 [Coprinopsis sp. MPI-PUGE-AT-0042]|nr:hypothetical protein BKA70DRAFT_371649 [Coprinopsis sp. MPI-PUGE-AT-0042]
MPQRRMNRCQQSKSLRHVEKAITSPDDLVSPASTVTPSQFSSMQHPQEPHHDNFVEIVHPIVDVDKVVTPPAIFEAATSKGPFDHAPVDASAPEVDIIHQIVEVDKVHTPPEIVEAAQEQGGTAPSSVVGTPSVVELTQEEAQPTLLPAEVQGPAEQEAQPEVIAHGKTDDISATAGEDVASETRVAGAEHLELAANGHTTNDDRDVNVKSEQDASPPLVATEEPAVEVSEEIAVPDAAPAEPSPTGEEVRLPQDEGDAKSSPPGDAQAPEDTASQDQAYAHVSDIEVPPKPPVDDAVVAEEVSTADKGVTEVKQDAGIPLTVENTTVVDNELEEHVPRVIQDDKRRSFLQGSAECSRRCD